MAEREHDDRPERAGTGGGDRGRIADTPTQVTAKGWKDVLVRVKAEAKDDHVTLLAAGVAFYALLALVPALAAMISLWGLVADPDEIGRQVVDALSAAPAEVRDLVTTQMESITQNSTGANLLALLVGIALALWSASSGVQHVIEAINTAYDEQETRGFVRRKGLALAFTLGAIVFVVMAFALIALLPALMAETGLGIVGRVIVGIVRWVVLAAGGVTALAILYRYGPDRDNPEWKWASPGALVAGAIWLVASIVFSIYTANFGKYNESYGSLGVVVVVMLWLFLTAVAVIIGAEVNAELERQTTHDTTDGRPEPMGERGAYAADTLGPTADEVRAGVPR